MSTSTASRSSHQQGHHARQSSSSSTAHLHHPQSSGHSRTHSAAQNSASSSSATSGPQRKGHPETAAQAKSQIKRASIQSQSPGIVSTTAQSHPEAQAQGPDQGSTAGGGVGGATSLRSFQAELETFAHQKRDERLRELKEAASGSTGVNGGTGGVNAKEGKKQSAGDHPAGHGKTSGSGVALERTLPTEHEADDMPIEASTPAEEDTADPFLESHLASRLAAGHGEYLIPLGTHPHPTKRFSTSSETQPSVGRSISDRKQFDVLVGRIRAAAKRIKAELSVLYIHDSSVDQPVGPSSNGNVPSSQPIQQASTAPSNGPYGALLVRLVPAGVEDIMEVRVAVVGNVDAGKSTMLGVLTRGGLDDGRGKARVALFRHKHEVETGRTSSVGMEILGFSPTGEPVVPTGHNAALDGQTITTAKREKMSWDEICSKAAKVVSFIDLAGHERYLKTTLFGLTGCAPDYVMLIVGGNAGLIGMSKEHLGVALALQVPVIICVTKIDMTPAHVLEQTVKQLVKVLKSPGCRKTPVFVETAEQAVECARSLGTERICPVFLVSNVTGANLSMLRTLLNALPTSQGGEKYLTDAPLEFNISDVFSVPFSGSVASGVITSGSVKTGDAVLLGPDSTGQFIPTVIKSIQRKRANVETAEAGQSVSFALKKIRRAQLRKGMVIVGKSEEPPKAVRRFEGQVLILYHNTTIQPKYQAVCHINSVRQTVRIVSLDHPKGVLRTGDRAKIIFEFTQGPEYIREGARLLFRENKTKGLGIVTRVNV